MTSEQDIRERVAAIDAAPTQDAWTIIRRQVNNTFIFGTERYGSIGIVWDALNAENNAEFIAHAPDDIRFLLGEVERLQTALAAVSRERDAAVARAEREGETRREWGRDRQDALDYVRWTKAALKPFALWAKEALSMVAFEGDSHDDRVYMRSNGADVTIGDLRWAVERYEANDEQTREQRLQAARQHDDAAERSPETGGG